MIINSHMQDKINAFLENEFYGWFLDFDAEEDSYFLSKFDSSNLNEELVYFIDSPVRTIVKGIRCKADGSTVPIRKGNKNTVIAEQIIENITLMKELAS